MDQFAVRFSRFFIKHRGINLAIIGGLTLFFAWHALQLQVFSQFVDLLPRNHSFVQVYEKYNRQFGSANVVTAAIVAKNGTIYDEQFLEKVYAFTDQIDKVEGVDHGQISSITAITIREYPCHPAAPRQTVSAAAITVVVPASGAALEAPW